MSETVRLDTIGQIHISVDDLARAVAFYRDVLGMSFLFEVPGQPMAFFDCGGVRLYLGKPENESFRSNPLIYYEVPSISGTHQALVERGVAFISEPHIVHSTATLDLWMADFRDPEGNVLVLMSEVEK
jgi:catechol 2,3-dioxygenase-like lactoylglutathione lyase family enzyme